MELPQTIEIKGSKVLTTKQIAEAYGVTKEKNNLQFQLQQRQIYSWKALY